jgi:hypothetical protein
MAHFFLDAVAVTAGLTLALGALGVWWQDQS